MLGRSVATPRRRSPHLLPVPGVAAGRLYCTRLAVLHGPANLHGRQAWMVGQGQVSDPGTDGGCGRDGFRETGRVRDCTVNQRIVLIAPGPAGYAEGAIDGATPSKRQSRQFQRLKGD